MGAAATLPTWRHKPKPSADFVLGYNDVTQIHAPGIAAPRRETRQNSAYAALID